MYNGLVLYTRQGCHLCEAFMEEMRQFDVALYTAVNLVEVDEDEAHRRLYGDKVPVLCSGQTEICRYFFDAEKIKSCLKLLGDSLE